MKIGIVGAGFVGGAMKQVLQAETFDTDPDKSTTGSLEQLVSLVDVVFVAVPTPQMPDGSCGVHIVDTVVQQLRGINPTLPICVRSTVTPGTCKRLGVVFNPEFLNQRTAVEDFAATDTVILGGDDGTFAAVYGQHFPQCTVIHVTATEAELIKYGANVAGATRVAFANELWQVATALGADYDAIRFVLEADSRLGWCHWQVPGPDGLLGFGGACFPKDINAWITVCEALHIKPSVSQGAWTKSCELRK